MVHVDATALRAGTDTGTSTAGGTDGRHEPDRHCDDDPNDHDPTEHHATLADGTAVAIATAQHLACDAAVVTVAHDAAGKVTHAARRTRRISSTLRRALRSRDGGCRFPGCTNRLTDAHHVVAWAHGGATTLRNLCSLCRRHHRLVHEHGYRLETAGDGELRFFDRDGTPVPLADEHRRILDAPHDAVAALRDAHAARGLPAIDALLADEDRAAAPA